MFLRQVIWTSRVPLLFGLGAVQHYGSVLLTGDWGCKPRLIPLIIGARIRLVFGFTRWAAGAWEAGTQVPVETRNRIVGPGRSLPLQVTCEWRLA